MSDDAFEGWAILEILGHRKLAGRLPEQEIAGSPFVRIDIPGQEGDVATQFYSPQVVYAITPTTEEIARAVALAYQPHPVTQWDLRALASPAQDAGPRHFADSYYDADDHYPADEEDDDEEPS